MLILKGPFMDMDHRSGGTCKGRRGVLEKEKGSCIGNGGHLALP